MMLGTIIPVRFGQNQPVKPAQLEAAPKKAQPVPKFPEYDPEYVAREHRKGMIAAILILATTAAMALGGMFYGSKKSNPVPSNAQHPISGPVEPGKGKPQNP